MYGNTRDAPKPLQYFWTIENRLSKSLQMVKNYDKQYETFINNVAYHVTESLVALFANDTTVVVCARSHHELAKQISCTYNELYEWFTANGFLLNMTKLNRI